MLSLRAGGKLNREADFMANELAAFSNELAAIVERAARNVVAVHARPRFSSSGVLWRRGIVVTAEHTIRREEEIAVTLPDGSNALATLVGSDAGSDIAVLRVDWAGADVAAPAEATPKPGNVALAIGRSQDSGPNATMGIVSAVSGAWRTWRGGRLDHYIRLDLTVYPGSSGGAVVNIDGQTIGIVTSALSRIAGLAIPVSTIDRVVDEILARGRVARGYVGLGLQPVELPDHQKGLLVVTVEPDGPAAKAGALIGDVLLRLGGDPVSDTEELQAAIESRAVGARVAADLSRGGAAHTIEIVIGERPGRR
jgi:S1-C subfamily serine protease